MGWNFSPHGLNYLYIMRLIVLCLLVFVSGGMWSQGSMQCEFSAKGCCPMCADRIVEALDVPGVRAVEWDQFKEKATVVYKPKKISEERIQQLVADSGHDTEMFTASDEVYNGLAACCLYRSGCQGCSDREKHEHPEEDDDRY